MHVATVVFAGSCQNQAAGGDIARELAGAREELAAQRARMDGIVDRLERLEKLMVRDSENAGESDSDSRSVIPVLSADAAPGETVRVAGEQVAPDLVPLVVAVGERRLVVAGDEVDRGGLAERFRAHVAIHSQAPVVLRIAAGVSSARTVEIADIAKEQGITQLAVVHEGTARKDKTRKKRRR